MGGLTRRLPVWSISPGDAAVVAAGRIAPAGPWSARSQPRVPAALDPRFTPRKHGTVRQRPPAQHPRVLTDVKARRYAPSASRLSALTPAPRALQMGNCPTMPHPDPAHSPHRLCQWIRR